MPESARAFAIEAVGGVTVHVDDSSDDETFDITVKGDDGVLESHRGVTIDSIVSVESEYFTATYVEPPSGP